MWKIQICHSFTHKNVWETTTSIFSVIKSFVGARWCYHQKAVKLRVKHIISFLGVNPFVFLGCRMKEKIISYLNLLIFCSTFQFYEIKKITPKSTFLRYFCFLWHPTCQGALLLVSIKSTWYLPLYVGVCRSKDCKVTSCQSWKSEKKFCCSA